ncbi:MAG: thiamine biosynthesis protein ApbE [Rhizobiaceae bacterium MnEN-MB40S]|nr:MAG: thiamine biosynthesis protein ApbE [Rhizobiaceae bacterium MnEN-MB40S]
MQRASAAMLPDGRRMHLHHGPIDLIVETFGGDQKAACRRAAARFETVLDELVSELTELRCQADAGRRFRGAVAARMQKAIAPFAREFITPMAAVAGAVADEILGAMLDGGEFSKAYVNNGGDTAFHLTGAETIRAAVANDHTAGITIDAGQPWRGVATSGWRGRSHSLGIADSVSVVASDAARADAAATMIANRVDLPANPKIERQPACALSPDSDLGDRLVTTGVASLDETEITEALDNGLRYADILVSKGLIGGAILILDGQTRMTQAGQSLFHTEGEMTHA